MRARTRFLLDIALMIALVAAYKPQWTGVTAHQWLSIAIIAPLLLHLLVNWEWALRVLAKFIERLLHTSRLNFVVDTLLFLSTITAMLSGFMVSPALLAPLGIHPTNPLVWHLVHSWSANATISLLALHFALHWRWLLHTAKRLAERPALAFSPARSRRPRVASPATLSAENPAWSAFDTGDDGMAAAPRASHVGRQAARAAKQRAMAGRAASVLGVTGVLTAAIFTGVGLSTPLLASASQHQKLVAVSSTVCPETGCTASTCHGTTHADPYKFYGLKKKTKSKAKIVKRRAVAASATSTKVASATGASKTSTSSSAKPKRTVTAKKATAKARTVVSAKPAVKHSTPKHRLYTCPVSGCQRSSCHASYGKSASAFY